MNQRKVGVVLSYFSIFLGFAISIVYTPLMLSLLGKSEFGLLNLASSVMSYLGLLTMGLGASFFRNNMRMRTIGDREGEQTLNGIYFTVYGIIGCIALVAGLLVANNVDLVFKEGLTLEEAIKMRVMLTVMSCNMAISLPLNIFALNIASYERFTFNKLVGILNTVLGPFVTYPLLLLGFRSVGLTVASVVMSLINIAVNVIYAMVKLRVRIKFAKVDPIIVKSIFVFSAFVFFNQIVDQINWSVDKVLLGMFRGADSVATYQISAGFNGYYSSISVAIISVFIPRVNQLVANSTSKNEIEDLLMRIGRILFMLLACAAIGFVLFGKEFIGIWLGDAYWESYYIGVLLLLPSTVPAIQSLFVDYQRALNRHRFRSIVLFVIAIINITLSVFLCRWYGGIGCALGTAIAVIIGNGFILNVYYQKILGLNMIKFWIAIFRLLPAVILSAVIGLLAKKAVLIKEYGELAFCLFIFLTAYGASMWFMGMNTYEKHLVKDPVQKMLVKVGRLR